MHYTSKLVDGQDLSLEGAKQMFTAFFNGETSEAEMASILTALKMKGESATEIAGAALAMREKTRQSSLSYPVLDTCGTGGDGSGSFNISTASAFVVAGAGGRVAKHGNRSVTSRSGSADVLEALSVHIDLDESESLQTLEEIGIGFFFAPKIHGSMRAVMPVRRALGFRTVFNLIGPLCNPVSLTGQIIGVGDSSRLEVMADAAVLMNLHKILFVCSENGMDELTLEGINRGILVENGTKKHLEITADKLGLAAAEDSALIGGSAKENAEIMQSVLSGKPSAYKDAVMLNAGAVLHVGGIAPTLNEGIALSRETLESGKALEKLEALRRTTQRIGTESKENRMVGM